MAMVKRKRSYSEGRAGRDTRPSRFQRGVEGQKVPLPAQLATVPETEGAGAGAGSGAGAGAAPAVTRGGVSGAAAAAPTTKRVHHSRRKMEIAEAAEREFNSYPVDEVRVPFRVIKCDAVSCTTGPKTRVVVAKQITARETELTYLQRPRNVLFAKKWHDAATTDAMVKFATRVLKELDVTVWVMAEEELPQFHKFDEKEGNIDLMDIVVCFGGDGTVLHVASLFDGPLPLMLPVAMGSLGFMTPFNPEQAYDALKRLVENHTSQFHVSIRTRLVVKVFRAGAAQSTYSARLSGLNEVLIDRGPNVSMSLLEAYVNDIHLTSVMADGIIISTPTGSTAYNVSAGGSMLLPTVPALCFTPICPHSLSFRPLLIPDSAKITIKVPPDARTTPVVSVDGRNSMPLGRGDWAEVTVSAFPLPVLSLNTATADWISSIKNQLSWNVRQRQKALSSL